MTERTRPTVLEWNLCKDIEGYTLDNDIQYATRAALPPKELPNKIDTSLNPALLITLLRSDFPLTPFFRNWLADMLDENCEADVNLILRNSKRGASKKRELIKRIQGRHAGLAGVKWMEKHNTEDVDSAVHAIMEETKYNIKRSALSASIRERKQGEALKKKISVKQK